MATLKITDDAQNPVNVPPFRLSPPPAFVRYLKSEILHFIASENFLRLKDKSLSAVAAPSPLHIGLQIGDTFHLGNTRPEINLTTTGQIMLTVNATKNANVFDQDSFAIQATVPEGTAYVGLILEGSVDPGISGSADDLSFGMDRSTGITFGYWQTFSTVANEPTLLNAFVDSLSDYAIVGDVTDVRRLKEHDICTVAGRNTLTVSASATLTASPNPLASASLPLGVGKITVQDGAIGEVTSLIVITGSYQIRVVRRSGDLCELSVLKQKGTTLKTEVSAAGGIAVNFGSTDILPKLLGAIDPDLGSAALAASGLNPDEVKAITSDIKSGIDHSLRASLNESLLLLTDDEAAFQYEIDLVHAQANQTSKDAINRALKGDLSELTALEGNIPPDGGDIAPGIKLLKSVLSSSRKKEITLKLNLLGLLNVVSISDLLRSSKTVLDAVTGDVTITDSATADSINAISDPLKRHTALRKLLFDSATVTAAYSASGTVPSIALSLHDVHSVLNQNTDRELMTGYLRWFSALALTPYANNPDVPSNFVKGGMSTCVLRTQFTDAQCRSMFLDTEGNARSRNDYLSIGRKAMLALLDANSPRYKLLQDRSQKAFEIGPSPGLADLVGVATSDPRYAFIEQLMEGDIYDVTWWASGMADAAVQVKSMIDLLGGRNPADIGRDQQFQKQRESLQKKMALMIKRSGSRFQEPWGMLALFYAAGAPSGASAKLVCGPLVIVRP